MFNSLNNYNNTKDMIRIGVFYDGNYFFHINNYYQYIHERRSRLSITGLHEFIRHQVAKSEGEDLHLCRIVDSHYFRGRMNARDASQRGNMLYYERVFDDILMSEGIVTHYLPIRQVGGRREEKGIDVWLALEAFENTIYKHFDVIVLVICDGDYVSLVRKLNSLGARVMILSWDFEYTSEDGRKNVTRTSQDLLEVTTYPVAMHELIENRLSRNDALVQNLFVQPETLRNYRSQNNNNNQIIRSEILVVKNGYGFIKYPPNNLFFYYEDVEASDFNDLNDGDEVFFTVGKNNKGEDVARNVRPVEEQQADYYEEQN